MKMFEVLFVRQGMQYKRKVQAMSATEAAYQTEQEGVQVLNVKVSLPITGKIHNVIYVGFRNNRGPLCLV